MYPIIITEEKFNTYRFIKQSGLINIKDYEAVCKEAWAIWGTTLIRGDCQYIEENYEHLKKEFKEVI